MRSKVGLVLIVLVAVGVGIGIGVFSSSDKKDEEKKVEAEPEKPRTRTRQEIRDRMKSRLEAAKEKAMSMRGQMKGMRRPGNQGYVPGHAMKSRKSATDLDGLLDKGEKDEALSADARKTVEEALGQREKLSGASVEQAECTEAFCKVTLNYQDPGALAAFQQEMADEPILNDRYRFMFTQSKVTLTGGAKPTSIPMETKLYYSNTDKPLPMDEELQEGPEE